MKLVPEAIFEQHTIVLGKTRSGKSSVMRLLVEHLLEKQKPVCIVDPKGDWWGLKSSRDGKHAGYPVVVFGGEHGDVPLNSRSGGAVAELAATGNRPCIIDLGGWMPGARTEFWIDFASTYFRMHRGRHYLVVDEVHNFCPKGKIMDPNAGKMLHWSNRLASEGLGKGISMIAASQRPQKVHNDFLTSCETLIAMRVIHAADRGALKDWIDGCGDPVKGKQLIDNIASMKRGEAWVWSPEAEFGPKRIQFPMFSTYDSFKAQGTSAPAKLKGWADVDLAEVTKKLEAAVKEAEANDPAKLKAKIFELQKELRAKVPAVTTKVVTEQKTVKASAAEIRRVLQEEIEPWRKFGQDVRRKLVEALDLLKNLRNASLEFANNAGFFIGEHGKVPDYPTLHPDFKALKTQVIKESVPRGTLSRLPQPEKSKVVVSQTSWDGNLPKGEKDVLIAIGRYEEGVERNQLTVLTGYKKSTRDAYLLRLKTKGLWENKNGRIVITVDGLNALGSAYTPQPATGEELRAYWMRELPSGEKKVLEELIVAAGAPVEREKLTEATGFQKSTRDAYLRRLGAKRLVETVGRGEVKASQALFA